MPFLDDIWITLTLPEVIEADQSQGRTGPTEEELKQALAAFHQARQARADYEVLEPGRAPLSPDQAPAGAVAVAATLGPKVSELVNVPGMAACVQAGLAQLQAYLNYRIMKRLAPKKLHLGWPVVPGGAAAPDLTWDQVLGLIAEPRAGVRVREGRLDPDQSLVYLYPLQTKPDQTSSCASCGKDCALRK